VSKHVDITALLTITYDDKMQGKGKLRILL